MIYPPVTIKHFVGSDTTCFSEQLMTETNSKNRNITCSKFLSLSSQHIASLQGRRGHLTKEFHQDSILSNLQNLFGQEKLATNNLVLPNCEVYFSSLQNQSRQLSISHLDHQNNKVLSSSPWMTIPILSWMEHPKAFSSSEPIQESPRR